MHWYTSIFQTALNMATISLATDMRQFGIMAAAVHPGWVQTPLGGPGANSSPQESVEDLMKLLERFGDRDTGCFYAPNGRKLPWWRNKFLNELVTGMKFLTWDISFSALRMRHYNSRISVKTVIVHRKSSYEYSVLRFRNCLIFTIL